GVILAVARALDDSRAVDALVPARRLHVVAEEGEADRTAGRDLGAAVIDVVAVRAGDGEVAARLRSADAAGAGAPVARAAAAAAVVGIGVAEALPIAEHRVERRALLAAAVEAMGAAGAGVAALAAVVGI